MVLLQYAVERDETMLGEMGSPTTGRIAGGHLLSSSASRVD
jgi:hypothetical protein